MIGGEFEIDPNATKGIFKEQENTYYYSSGRAALYQILKSIIDHNKHIWLPDYLCNTVINSVERAGYLYSFYELNDNLEVSIDDLTRNGFQSSDVILLINYFGLQHLQGITTKIRDKYPSAIIIEDDVQAFFEFHENPNPEADYRYSSLRKTFAIPDGAPVYTKHPMPLAMEENTFAPFKYKAAYLKFRRDTLQNDEEYLSQFKIGNDLIDSNLDSVMSVESKALYGALDIEEVKRKRKANSKYIVDALSKAGIKTVLPIPDDCTPLFVPIWLEKRDDIRKKMFAKEVFCPVHWPLEGLKLKKGAEMAEHELSLIVDQRYEANDIEEILKKL